MEHIGVHAFAMKRSDKMGELMCDECKEVKGYTAKDYFDYFICCECSSGNFDIDVNVR